jgi:hypothetical protein
MKTQSCLSHKKDGQNMFDAQAAHNKAVNLTRWFLRFSGHSELTIQECIRCQNPALEPHTNTVKNINQLQKSTVAFLSILKYFTIV